MPASTDNAPWQSNPAPCRRLGRGGEAELAMDNGQHRTLSTTSAPRPSPAADRARARECSASAPTTPTSQCMPSTRTIGRPSDSGDTAAVLTRARPRPRRAPGIVRRWRALRAWAGRGAARMAAVRGLRPSGIHRRIRIVMVGAATASRASPTGAETGRAIIVPPTAQSAVKPKVTHLRNRLEFALTTSGSSARGLGPPGRVLAAEGFDGQPVRGVLVALGAVGADRARDQRGRPSLIVGVRLAPGGRPRRRPDGQGAPFQPCCIRNRRRCRQGVSGERYGAWPWTLPDSFAVLRPSGRG